jgi:ABC-type sulfate transport system permease component
MRLPLSAMLMLEAVPGIAKSAATSRMLASLFVCLFVCLFVSLFSLLKRYVSHILIFLS